jgi:YHS domain-containing protein
MIEVVFYLALLLFVLRAAGKLWGGIQAGLKPPTGARRDVAARGVHMVRDPIFGTFVVPERAVSLTVGADVVYFCSATCRDAYRARPAARSGRVEGRTA